MIGKSEDMQFMAKKENQINVAAFSSFCREGGGREF